MKKAEMQQKFHEAFINIFFPPQQTPLQHQVEDEVGVVVPEGSDAHSDPDHDLEERNSSDDDINECVPQKLTRAQRKRIRRRKLKEAASQRRKIIGPLLPSTHEGAKGETSNLEKEPVHGNGNETVKALGDECRDRPGHMDC